VFTANRGENTAGISPADQETASVKVKVGLRPNGLAYDPGRGLLVAANVGDPSRPVSFSISVVDVDARAMIADIPVPGRTRWAVEEVRKKPGTGNHGTDWGVTIQRNDAWVARPSCREGVPS
jgi:hypothetical protein